MATLLSPNAQQSKLASDAAVLAATQLATDNYVNAILVSIVSASSSGLYQYTANYAPMAATVDLTRLVHVLGVDLSYRVSQNPTAQTILIDWSSAPSLTPPSKDGTGTTVYG